MTEPRPRKLVILGAAGRDFHDFNVHFRHHPGWQVVAFTATQIPFIAGRSYPPELAGPRYPQGIPIVAESELPRLIREHRVDQVCFCYSDVPHEHVMHLASVALAHGAGFSLLGPRDTQLESKRPVVAVLASRTGAGKSTVTRHLWRVLRESGRNPAIVRHPMPYGTLRAKVERYASTEDLLAAGVSIEAMEEYQQHLDQGAAVFAGVDYAAVLAAAEAEGDLILWDGGNNDGSFFRPHLTLTVLDPTRPGEEDRYWPGEANVRSADLLVINKVNAARAEDVVRCEASARRLNPDAPIVHLESVATASDPAPIAGRTVLVVEDGPSLTHGGVREAAGAGAARALGCTLLDPRPWAVGSIARALQDYPHIGPVLPALGYSAQQLAELAQTIAAVPCEAVVIATPAPLERLIAIPHPTVRVRFEARELERGAFARIVARLAR